MGFTRTLLQSGSLDGLWITLRTHVAALLGGGTRDPLPAPGTPMRRPVLLVHGFASSPRVLRPLERYLRTRLGRAVACVDISPGLDDLRDSAHQIARQIDALSSAGDLEGVDVIGHSMGGLVATYLLKRIDRGRRVRSVITLGTPHRGTPLATLGTALLGGVSPALAQMRPDSALVRELRWLPTPAGSRLVSISAGADLLVPEGFAELQPLPGQRNLRLAATSHWGLLLARASFAAIGQLLDARAPAHPHHHPRRPGAAAWSNAA